MFNERAFAAVVAAVMCCAFDARAEPKDPAAAQALFDEARGLMNAGNFAEACPKLAESQRLDPGIGTQFHLASCYEKLGRIASAWVAYLDVASMARAAAQHDREEVAQEHADKLEPRLPRLTIVVPEANQVEGLEVRRDDVLVRRVQWGTPIPVDPGTHRITASAPGRRTASHALRAEERRTLRFELPALVPDPGGVTPAAAAPAEDSGSTSDRGAGASTAVESDAGVSSGGQSGWLYGLGAVGVVGLGAGTTFALMARSTNERSKDHCQPDDPNVCKQRGVDLRDDALAYGNWATVGLGVGAAALVGAGLVWALEDPHAESTARAGEHRTLEPLSLGAAPQRGGSMFFATGRF